MKLTKINCLLSCLLLFAFSTLKAQDAAATTSGKVRYNVLKTNILSPLSIGYERGFGKHFSVSAYFLYFPSVSTGAPTDKFGFIELTDPSTGFSVEARWYTSKTKPALNGFYVGGYYLFRILDITVEKTTTTSNFKALVPSDLTSYGLMIGRQKIRAQGFTTGFNFGLGYYSVGSIPTYSDDGSSDTRLLSKLSSLKSGIGPRLTWSLGYAF